MKIERLSVEAIRHNRNSSRELKTDVAESIAESMEAIGQLKPIIVRACAGDDEKEYEVVCGDHRLLAARLRGLETIPCSITEADETTCRMMTISENLHRSELTVAERGLLLRKWMDLNKGVSAQLAQKPQGGRPKGGISEAARQLGLNRDAARRLYNATDLTPEALALATELGLADNQTALLKIAEQPKDRQVDYIKARVEAVQDEYSEAMHRHAMESFSRQYRALVRAWKPFVRAWNKADLDVQNSFLAGQDELKRLLLSS